MSRRLSEHTVASSAFRYAPHSGFGVKTKLSRSFSDTTDLHLGYTMGWNSNVSASFIHRIGDLGHIKAKLHVWDDHASAGVSRHFAPKNGAVSADVGVKLMSRVGEGNAFAIELGGDRKVTARASVGLKLSFSATRVVATVRLRRDGHTLSLPVLISDYVDRYVVGASLLVPAIALTLVQALVIAPAKRRARIERILKMREANAAYTAKCRKEAEAAVKLLQSTVASKRRFESNVKGGGLIIVSAQYGQLDPAMQFDAEEAARFETRQAARRRAREAMARGDADAAAAAAAQAGDDDEASAAEAGDAGAAAGDAEAVDRRDDSAAVLCGGLGAAPAHRQQVVAARLLRSVPGRGQDTACCVSLQESSARGRDRRRGRVGGAKEITPVIRVDQLQIIHKQ
jgi:hypothetical protein